MLHGLKNKTYGLKHPIEPKFINKTDMFTTFDFTSGAMCKSLKNKRCK